MKRAPIRTPNIAAGKSPAALLIGGLLLLGIGFAVGWNGHDQMQLYLQESIIGALRGEIEVRDRQITTLQRELAGTRQRTIALERALQIDQVALQEMREQLRLSQSQRLKLEEELAFLRGVVGNGEEGRFLRIRNFRLIALPDGEGVRYHFTLTRVREGEENLKGEIRISLRGMLAGREQTLSLAEVTAPQQQSLAIDLRHFQEFSGVVKLPEGLTPISVLIDVKPELEEANAFSREYDWVVSG